MFFNFLIIFSVSTLIIYRFFLSSLFFLTILQLHTIPQKLMSRYPPIFAKSKRYPCISSPPQRWPNTTRTPQYQKTYCSSSILHVHIFSSLLPELSYQKIQLYYEFPFQHIIIPSTLPRSTAVIPYYREHQHHS